MAKFSPTNAPLLLNELSKKWNTYVNYKYQFYKQSKLRIFVISFLIKYVSIFVLKRVLLVCFFRFRGLVFPRTNSRVEPQRQWIQVQIIRIWIFVSSGNLHQNQEYVLIQVWNSLNTRFCLWKSSNQLVRRVIQRIFGIWYQNYESVNVSQNIFIYRIL